MKSCAAYVLLLAAALPTALGTLYSVPYVSARDVPTEDTIREMAGGSPVYAALEEAFRGQLEINNLKPPKTVVKREDLIRNDLEEGNCAPNIIIFARGTNEDGNMGNRVGVPLQNAVDAILPGKVIYQGVNNYPADLAGYLAGGSATGAANMAAQVIRAVTQCPGSRIFLSGYSQGAQVTHKAARQIPTRLRGAIAGIVVFGDPRKYEAFPGALNRNVLTICNSGDLICQLGLPLPTDAHLDYEKTTPRAAAYIKALAA